MRRGAGHLVLAAAVALLSLAAVALAEIGDLTPKDCIDDRAPNGPDTCAGSARGLDGADSVAISPNGKSVYVAGGDDDAIVHFERNANGRLVAESCVDDNDTGPDACAQSTDGLNGANSVAVSADGKSVYVASVFDEAIVRFTRNAMTGELTPAGCVDDNDTGFDACAQSTDGLSSAASVAVSADGKSVYAASQGDDAIVRLTRNTTSGALTPAGCVMDNDSGIDACAQTADGLDGAASVAVSVDGKSVYVASLVDDAIARFKRDTASGALTPKGCIDDNDTGTDACILGVDGLDFPLSVAVSADGTSVYVASFLNDAVVHLERGTNGGLGPVGCVDDNDTGVDACAQTTDGLDGAASVAVSADGKSVYVASITDDAVVRLKRSIVAEP